jgi:hypothetical protein
MYENTFQADINTFGDSKFGSSMQQEAGIKWL